MPQWETKDDFLASVIKRHRIKSYGYENNINKYRQIQKISRKLREEGVEAI